jgi:class 3 adenylate cyclase
LDYGAIGTRYLASRLCGEAKPGQILIPQRLLGTVEELVDAEPVGELHLKGFHRPITAYNILGLKTEQALLRLSIQPERSLAKPRFLIGITFVAE